MTFFWAAMLSLFFICVFWESGQTIFRGRRLIVQPHPMMAKASTFSFVWVKAWEVQTSLKSIGGDVEISNGSPDPMGSTNLVFRS